REAGRGTVTAEPLEEVRARAERTVEIEGRNRSPGALPQPVSAGDQHDRPVIALDKPRRHDADHALVPVLAPEHVAAPALLRLGPFLDLLDRCAADAVFDRLTIAVQFLRPICRGSR